MPLRATAPKLPAPSYTVPVPMHATVELEVTADPDGKSAAAVRNDGRSVLVSRDTAHKPLAGGKAQLVRETLAPIPVERTLALFRLPRKSELVLQPALAPGKDGAPVPCHVTALDVVESPARGWGFGSATARRWRLTCAPVTRPKGRKDSGPWYVFVGLR